MRRTALSILLILMSVASFGATQKGYDSMWKQVNEKISKDLPRDAIAILRQISQKAEKEQQYGQLLAAELQQAQQLSVIAPDSLEPAIDRLKSQAQKSEKNTPLYSVYCAVLGGIDCESMSTTDKQDYFNKALAHPEILETIPSSEYTPLVDNLKPNTYNLQPNTLLDVIAHEAKRYQWLSDYYAAKGNNEKACLELYYALKYNTPTDNDYSTVRKYRNDILAGINKYGDIETSSLLSLLYYESISNDEDISEKTRYEYLDSCINRWPKSEVTKTFKRYQQDITRPEFSLSMHGQNCVLPDCETKLYLTNIRNVRKIDITVTSINDKEPLYTLHSPLYTDECYSSHIDSIILPKLPAGVYKITASTEEKSMTRTATLNVSDIRILSIKLSKDQYRLISVSATTGKPIKNTTIRLSEQGWKDGKRQILTTEEITTDKKGEVIFDLKKYNLIYAYTPEDKGFLEQNISGYFSEYVSHQKNDIATIFTDRSIYRPGQKIQGTVIVHNNTDIYNIHAVSDKKVYVKLTDANYETVTIDSITTDSMGHGAFCFNIPSDHMNGSWNISVSGATLQNTSTSIHIEEYKRPTFEIITPKVESCTYVDTQTSNLKPIIYNIKLQSKTFSDVPVQNAMVTYSISRSQSWCWWWRNKTSNRLMATDTLKTDAKGQVSIPVELTLPERASGRYNFRVAIKVTNISGETHETTVNIPVASADLKMPEKKVLKPEEQEAFYEISAKTFGTVSSPRGGREGAVTFRMGSTLKDIRAYYSLISEKGVVESGSMDFSNEIISRTFKYKETYGEGLSLFYVWVKDGKTHAFSTTILKPQPDLSLKTRWITFRDRTQPGSKEKWTLKIDNSSLSTLQSSIFTIYDRSLDQIVKHSWKFNVLSGYGYSLYTTWNATHQNTLNISSSAKTKQLKFGTLPEPSAFNHTYYPYSYLTDGGYMLGQTGSRRLLTSNRPMATADMSEAKVMMQRSTDTDKDISENSSLNTEHLTLNIRKDFSETAFFTPNLLADKEGNISLEFTMPEAMTSWRLLGFVHDGQMHHNFLDSTCVAQKDIMVQPNLPRFIREGDKATVSATISNTTDKEISGKAVMQLLTPGTENIVLSEIKIITIAGNGQISATFNIDTKSLTDTLYTIRIAAIGENSEDGEQHNLAILPASEQVTNTIPLTFFRPGTYSVNADSLWLNGSTRRQLIKEYTDNPAWLMIEALPTLSGNDSKDAISTMAAIYASSITNAIQTVVDSTYTSHFTLNTQHLHSMQLPDGSFPWWQGMQGSYYITTSVATMMARQKVILGTLDADLEDMLSKALTYMDKKAAEEAKELKRLAKKGYKNLHPSETTTEYLYITALLNKKGNSTTNYLVNLMTKVPREYTILGKARAAVIFSAYNKNKFAQQYLESIRQYSVYTPLAGRYYDTKKAYYSWRNYRIPTEVAAIEALSMVAPKDTITVRQMQQWLLHEKRTTSWDTPLNTVDAVYAFMRPTDGFKVQGSRFKVQGSKLNNPKGYTRDTLDVATTHEVTINKTSSCTSWGAIYATQTAPLSEIDSMSNGITITREIANSSPRGGQVGATVKVRITITADRDYDFVTVTDNRPACLEPVETTSGYRMFSSPAGGGWVGAYQEIKDRCTKYHVDKLAKGKHVIETSYYIDRQGDYTSGTCTATCSYAPEFSGRAASTTIKVE